MKKGDARTAAILSRKRKRANGSEAKPEKAARFIEPAVQEPSPPPEISRNADPVSLDQLAWSEVPMPDRLDDVEGFFGLEEIEGVEVIKRPGDRKVEFKFAEPVKKSSKERKQDLRDARAQALREDLKKVDNEVEEYEEWGGIEDTVPTEANGSPTSSISKETTKKEKKKKAKKTKASKVGGEDDELPANIFAGLEDETEGEQIDSKPTISIYIIFFPYFYDDLWHLA
jgi:ATP-dependent RNA helicase DDX24/MAK5